MQQSQMVTPNPGCRNHSVSAAKSYAWWGVPTLALTLAVLLAACGTTGTKEVATADRPRPPPPTAVASAPPPASLPPLSNKYYKDDGPGDVLPANIDTIPDAIPRLEPLHRFANRPYTVLGREYVPATTLRPYKERGVASWYGRKFHGQKTSNGETYDMYAMTAAHPTLPLPSYVRVTNAASGQSVVVRVNDRGPFLYDRVIDLSFAAAHRVGIAAKGSGEVVVEAILPTEAGTLVATAPLPPVAALAPGKADAPVAPSRAPPAQPAPDRPSTASAAGAVPMPPISRDSGGYVVQLGAFQNNVNAQNFLAHVQAQLATAEVTPKVRETSGLYRVYVGPFTQRDEARRVADRITSAFGYATAVAPHN